MTSSFSKQALKTETGRTPEEWMGILEREADQSWSHDDIAAYLNTELGVGEEWSELIARAYGEKLGRKPVGLTAATGFQIGVSRTLPISKEQVWSFMMSPEGLRLWIGDIPSLRLEVGHKYESKDGTFGELRVVKPLQQLRMTWQRMDWDKPSTLQIRFLSNRPGKTTIGIHQENLDDLFTREEMKRKWEDVIVKILENTAKSK